MRKLTVMAALLLALSACDSDPEGGGTVTPPPPPPDPNNNAPTIADQAFSTDEDQPLAETIAADDADGDDLIYTLIVGSGPVNGRLDSLDSITGDFIYTPNRDYLGDDSFDVQVDDGRGGIVSATITITMACPPPQTQCSWDKFDLVDDPALSGAAEPSIAVDTAIRVNVAFTEDNSSAGGSSRDLFVYQTDVLGRSFTKVPGSGPNGALNDTSTAARPDLVAGLVLPTTIAVTWDEGDNIFLEARSDLAPDWADISGNPNTTAAQDPALVLDAVTGSAILVWTETADPANNNILLAANTGFSTANPGVWAPLDAPLDSAPANSASRPAVASDDVPGGGINIFGRTTVAFAEVIGGVSQLLVRQCANASDGSAASCTALGPAVNLDPAVNALNPDIAVPSAATAILLGQSPLNPLPVVARVEDGELFVSGYDDGTDSWTLMADAASPSGSLNNAPGLGIAADPAIVVDLLGRYTVVWTELNPNTGRQGIYSKRLDAANSGVWTALGGILNCDPDQPATAPDIAVDTTGRPYITFQELEANGESRIVVLSFEG